MIQVIIDRFEGNMAVCEKPDRTMINIPHSRMPAAAKEGDVINIEGELYEIDFAATSDRKKSILSLMGDLRRKKP